MSKNKSKSFSKISVYNQMLKYPMFPLSRGTKVQHNIDGIIVEMHSKNLVCTNTEEKLFALLYIIKNKKVTSFEIINSKEKDINYVVVKCRIKDLADACNTNDYKNIIQELENLLDVKFTFYNPNGSRFSFVPLSEVRYDSNKAEVTIVINNTFYKLCQSAFRSLHIDFKIYQKLPPFEKNFYKFLIANSDKKYLKYKTIAERCNLESNSKKYSKYYITRRIKKAAQIFYELQILEFYKTDKKGIHFEHTFKPTPQKQEDQEITPF